MSEKENMGKFTSKFSKDEAVKEASEVLNGDKNENKENLNEIIAKLEAEKVELKDVHLRSIAEAENFKKRLLADKENAVKYALSGVIKDLAVLIDNFHLSNQNAKLEELEKNSHFKMFFDAININVADLMKFLEKNGVRRINPLNEKFNPSEHEAVSQVKIEGTEPGIVTQVLSGGYALADRVIKPAIVIVSA